MIRFCFTPHRQYPQGTGTYRLLGRHFRFATKDAVFPPRQQQLEFSALARPSARVAALFAVGATGAMRGNVGAADGGFSVRRK